jgi:hypothetical protein
MSGPPNTCDDSLSFYKTEKRAKRKDILPAKDAEIAALKEAACEWAVSRWKAEVENRPMQNIHRRSLDDTWRQVIRHFDGDDVALCGPAHDERAALEMSGGVK